MNERRSLLETLQGWIERTYDMKTGISGIGEYVFGDQGFREHYADESLRREIGSAQAEAAVLVRESGPGPVRASLYYPDALIDVLERHHPFRGLDERNIDEFAVFVEELDHLLTLADRAHQRRGRQCESAGRVR